MAIRTSLLDNLPMGVYICRTSRRRNADREIGIAAGHAGHADSQNCGAGTGARLWNFTADPADFRGSAASAAGVAVPRAASLGKTRVARRGVGRVRQWQAGQVLQIVGKGPQATGQRGIELAPPGRGGGSHSADGRIGVGHELVEITFPKTRARSATGFRASLSYRETHK